MASDTFSATLGWLQMQTGNDNNSWGTNANNAVFQIFEDAIANFLTSAVTGGTLDLSTNPPPVAASQVHYAALVFTGALTSNQTVYVPNLTKFWWINNQTSGAFNLNIQTKSGSGTVGSGSVLTLGTLTGGSGYVNGTYYNVPLSGGSGSGLVATVVVSGGSVSTVTITSAGQRFLSTDTGLTTSNANLGGSGSGFAINVSTVGNVIPQNAGWQLVICDGSGNIVVSPSNTNQFQSSDGSIAAPALSFVNETNTGFRRAGFNDIRLTVGGSDILQITGSGASKPSVVNVVNGSLQQAGVQVIPPGTVLPYDGVNLPSGFLWRNGQTASRATYPNLLNALRATFTGNYTIGVATIGVTGVDLRNLGLEGSVVEGTGVTGLTIQSITGPSGPFACVVTLSGNATTSTTGTVYAYPFGNGDGSTTFGIGDGRGSALIGRDNMGTAGASAAGRITVAGCGINGISLGASGGSQNQTILQANLPSVSFGVSIGAGQGAHNHTVTAIATGAIGITGGGTTAGQFAITTSTSTLPGMSGSAASGGSGTALVTVPPASITNFIIKT